MRNHCISVRLSPDELKQLDAQRGTMTRGAFMRRAWAGAPLPRPIHAVNIEALQQLRGVASNLNQLARRVNQDQALDLITLAADVSQLRACISGLL